MWRRPVRQPFLPPTRPAFAISLLCASSELLRTSIASPFSSLHSHDHPLIRTHTHLHTRSPQTHFLSMSPKERFGDITNIYSDDPRIVITKSDGQPRSGRNKDGPVELAKIQIDPTLGPWNENYVPQFKQPPVGELPPITVRAVSNVLCSVVCSSGASLCGSSDAPHSNKSSDANSPTRRCVEFQ